MRPGRRWPSAPKGGSGESGTAMAHRGPHLRIVLRPDPVAARRGRSGLDARVSVRHVRHRSDGSARVGDLLLRDQDAHRPQCRHPVHAQPRAHARGSGGDRCRAGGAMIRDQIGSLLLDPRGCRIGAGSALCAAESGAYRAHRISVAAISTRESTSCALHPLPCQPFRGSSWRAAVRATPGRVICDRRKRVKGRQSHG